MEQARLVKVPERDAEWVRDGDKDKDAAAWAGRLPQALVDNACARNAAHRLHMRWDNPACR